MLDGIDDEPGFLFISDDLADTEPAGPYFEVILGEIINEWAPSTPFSTTTKIFEHGCAESHWVPKFMLTTAVNLDDGLEQSSSFNEMALNTSANLWAMVFVAGDSPLTRFKTGQEDFS
jgi:hypothetical protein